MAKKATRKRARLRLQMKRPLDWLLWASLLFQGSACALLVFKSGSPDWVAAALAFSLPALGWFWCKPLARLLRADSLLVTLTDFLCGLGTALLYALSPALGLKHAVHLALGVAMFALCALAVRRVRAWRILCALATPVCVALLLLPAAIGQEINGAKNWIRIPGFGSFQPSELVKIALVFILARSFSTLRGVKGMLPGLAFAIVCLGLLMLQKDLGTALLYYLTTLLLFWTASSNLPLTLAGLAGGAGAAALGYKLFAHVRTRVAIWRNPGSDALGKGYQIVQALTAIASGGLFGVGLGNGESRVIPAYSTDFIFAVLCEQLGLAAGIAVLTMYAILIARGAVLSLRARTRFLALSAMGATALLGLQTFVIIGGVIKLIPLTGVTLPFLSAGGTSMLCCLGLVGILCGVNAATEDGRDADERMAAPSLEETK